MSVARSFKDRTVVIAGGSAGLGLSLAHAFAQEGSQLYLVARDADRLEAAASQLRERAAAAVTPIVADVTSNASVQEGFTKIRQAHAPISVLVNAVGVSDRAAILDVTPERLQSHWEINVLSAVRCTRAAAEDLLQAQGVIINIGSLASKIAAPYLGTYPVTKFALAAYSQQLRLELGPRGVHVLHVCPGPIQRPDAGRRYDAQATNLPDAARAPGGGAQLKALDADQVSRRIVSAARRQQAELVLPGKVRWLAALAQLTPAWADWVIRRRTVERRTQ